MLSTTTGKLVAHAFGLGSIVANPDDPLNYVGFGVADDLIRTTRVIDNGVDSISAMRRLKYESVGYHTSRGTTLKNAAPINGQEALDFSIPIGSNTTRRVGIDYRTNDFVVFDETRSGVFHGHVRTWAELNQKMRNALTEAGMSNRKGEILFD